MGSPIVFHTAPPHPASNARIICSPQLVGGALASQNGFGQLIPANSCQSAKRVPFIARSSQAAIPHRGPLSIRDSIHHFAAAVDAIAAAQSIRIGGLPRSAIDHHAPVPSPRRAPAKAAPAAAIARSPESPHRIQS